MQAKKGKAPDHEALGEQALAMRCQKRYSEALDLYRQAAKAAASAGDRAAEAKWISKQGQIHRLCKDPAAAQEAFENARAIFASLGATGLAGLGDQEGNLGLLAADRGNDFEAEFAYRRAIDLCEAAGDMSGVSLWASNLGKALSRRRRYQRAWDAFRKSVAAAQSARDPSMLASAAMQWSGSYSAAHRWGDAAEALATAARAAPDPRERAQLIGESLRDLMRAGEWKRAQAMCPEVLEMLRAGGAPPAAFEQIEQIKRDAAQALASPAKRTGGPAVRPLDEVAVGAMAHYEKMNQPGAMGWVGHLICDIHWALGAPGLPGWEPFLSEPNLYYRILGDVMFAMCNGGRAEESLELSQRYKGAAFALPFLAAVERAKDNPPEVRRYLDALAALREAVSALAAGDPQAFHPLAHRVRAAGEALLEAGEYLHDRDRGMHARLGGVVPLRHLIDALPAGDPVGILDFVVTSKGFLAHLVAREGTEVRVVPFVSADLSAELVDELAMMWGPEMVHASDLERQRQVLDHIGEVLHDRFFCKLAHWLAEHRIGQVILVPDLLTRHLPLHLARVCAKDITIPGVPVADAEFFCEVLPVEYASCLQAVALSQQQRRPQNLDRIASFSDSKSDLPGARHTGQWLATRIGGGIEYLDRRGSDVTREAVEDEMRRSKIVMIATHGCFDTAHPEASFLQLHDHDWTAKDIASLPPLEHSPAVVLAACEIAAAKPGEDPEADGIPGAMLSAGAAFVLGSRWPVEDVSMGILIERFLHHMTRVGLRPAAVLFRAIKDLRKVGRAEAVECCRALLDQMAKDGTREQMPDAYAKLDWYALQLESGGKEHPFAAPACWGGVVVTGSGWNGLAGGVAGGVHAVEGLMQLEQARALLESGQAAEARMQLAGMLGGCDGIVRAQALELLAAAIVESAHPACRKTAHAEAIRWLDEAGFVARAEQRPQLLRNIKATRAKLELLQEG